MTEPAPKSIFDIEPDAVLETRLDAEAEAAYAAGRIVPHADVVAWLESWGKPSERPCPKPVKPLV
jgi:predicted transcriptional regulator